MKKIVVFVWITFCLLTSAYSQLKIISSTKQKTYGGMGGIFMNYTIEFKGKTSAIVEIDSIKSLADFSEIKFSFTRYVPCCNKIVFGYALAASERCRTCPDVTPKPLNLTKGVIVYYRRGEKKSSFKMTKFKQLEDIKAP